MCYCKDSHKSLDGSTSAATEQIPELEAKVQSAEGALSQLQSDVTRHMADRVSARTAIAEANALRAKEKQLFDNASAETGAELEATKKAIDAISRGLGESFLQTSTAADLRSWLLSSKKVDDDSRDEVLSFLSGEEEDESPGTSEVVGILKQLEEEMTKDSKESNAEEATSVQDHAGLVAAKQKEDHSLTARIETKLTRIGQMRLELEENKVDLIDTKESLSSDEKFARELEKSCADEEKRFEENTRMRREELLALADTIKILNDDDSSGQFASKPASFLQSVKQVHHVARGMPHKELDLAQLVLLGKKVGLDGVKTMIAKLVTELKADQKADDSKKASCAKDLDRSEDKQKIVETEIKDFETSLAEVQAKKEATVEDIQELTTNIEQLDKSVAESTELRKEENAEFQELTRMNPEAIELLRFAKNRLNKFYNPKLALPEKAASEESADIAALQSRAAPPKVEAYAKNSGSSGVLALLGRLIADLELQSAAATKDEELAQEDYEQSLAETNTKRVADSNLLTDLKTGMSDLDGSDLEQKGDKREQEKKLSVLVSYRASLHKDCDWLMQNFDTRKELRAQEVESLQRSMAALSGAASGFLVVRN